MWSSSHSSAVLDCVVSQRCQQILQTPHWNTAVSCQQIHIQCFLVKHAQLVCRQVASFQNISRQLPLCRPFPYSGRVPHSLHMNPILSLALHHSYYIFLWNTSVYLLDSLNVDYAGKYSNTVERVLCNPSLIGIHKILTQSSYFDSLASIMGMGKMKDFCAISSLYKRCIWLGMTFFKKLNWGENSTKIRPTRTFADSAYFFHSSTLNQNFDLAKTLMSSKGLM